MVSYHLSRFDGHKYHGSVDMMILVCYKILEDTSSKSHVTMSRSSSYLVTILPTLVAIGTVVVNI